MARTLIIKGQVTIPKHIRDSLGLKPGAQLDFAVNRDEDMVLHRTNTTQTHKADRFESVRGNTDEKW